jgi:electron transfer flavoprotein alpha subunit
MSRLRRDPRAECAARTLPSSGRPRLALALVADRGRSRRDPRREQAVAEITGQHRRRFDLSLVGFEPSHVAVASHASLTMSEKAPRLRVIAEPAYLVFAVADAPGGRLTSHDRQLLGAARLLADAGGGAVVLLSAAIAGDAGEAGADRYGLLSTDIDPDRRAEALLVAIAEFDPRHVLWPESQTGGDLARRVAVRLGENLFCGAEQVSAKLVSRPTKGGRVEQRGEPPRLITLADGAAAPCWNIRHEAHRLNSPVLLPHEAVGAILSVEEIAVDPFTVSLAEAEFVVSAGNGVSDFLTFAALARALGATPGASRMICDAGLMPRAAQVGASGTVLDARCYFALGIAGAPQHLQGVAACAHVVAVNTDLHAAMIARADLAIVADAQAVMPELLACLAGEP